MRVNLPSLTAQFVSLFRALGDLKPEIPGFRDPYAHYFLPLFWKPAIGIIKTKLLIRPKASPYDFYYRRLALTIQCRTVIIDNAIRKSLPFEQFVILGAGLDARAWRMQELSKVKIFEVDHPATQSWKMTQLKKFKTLAQEASSSITFVPVDFTRDSLEDCLLKSGFVKEKRTFWLWEGVTMYLDEDDVKKTFHSLSALSPAGGTVAATYLRKNLRSWWQLDCFSLRRTF
jgi:methyltransferase (TIGR00027 family)